MLPLHTKTIVTLLLLHSVDLVASVSVRQAWSKQLREVGHVDLSGHAPTSLPLTELQQSHNVLQSGPSLKGALGGTISKGLSGWGFKQDRTTREVVQSAAVGRQPSESSNDRGGLRNRRESQVQQPFGSPSANDFNQDDNLQVSSTSDKEGEWSASDYKPSSSSDVNQREAKISSDSDRDYNILPLHSLGSTDPEFDPSAEEESSRAKAQFRTRSSHVQNSVREAIEREWEKQGLGRHLDPRELAQRVSAISVPNARRNTIGKFASRKIRLGKGDKYFAQYSREKYNLQVNMKRVKRRLIKSGKIKSMNEDQIREYCLEKSINRKAKAQRFEGLSMALWRREKVDAKMKQTEQILQRHLASKGLDLMTIPVENIEKEIRDLDLDKIGEPNMTIAGFTNYLYSILRAKRNASDVQISMLIRSRKDYNIQRYSDKKLKGKRKGSRRKFV